MFGGAYGGAEARYTAKPSSATKAEQESATKVEQESATKMEQESAAGGHKNLHMKAARVARGLSQAELAAAVGATRQTIGLIEAGGYNPTLKLCIAICRVLDCTLNDLFWEEGN